MLFPPHTLNHSCVSLLLQEVCPSWVYQSVSREQQSHSASHKGGKHVTGMSGLPGPVFLTLYHKSSDLNGKQRVPSSQLHTST